MASLATIMHSPPLTRPMPVTMPAAGAVAAAVVHAVGGERRQLEEGRAGIEQRVDALARQQLAAREVLLPRFLGAAARWRPPSSRAGRRPARCIGGGVGAEFVRTRSRAWT